MREPRRALLDGSIPLIVRFRIGAPGEEDPENHRHNTEKDRQPPKENRGAHQVGGVEDHRGYHRGVRHRDRNAHGPCHALAESGAGSFGIHQSDLL